VSTNLEMDTKRIGRRNQSWPEALKREIVAASAVPGVSVSRIARQYNVNANQVFKWRKLYGEDFGSLAGASSPNLIPVTITAEPAGAMRRLAMVGTVEIELGGKYCVRVGKGVDVETLRSVVDLLERR
jgi:transposase